MLVGMMVAVTMVDAISEPTRLPVLTGPSWTIATNPDIGPLTGPSQQPVDFSVWQAADGTWQLWSCVRGTKVGGTGRILCGWEGKNLTDTDWRFTGIKMDGDPALGETQGGLQAPHVFRDRDRWVMAYGDWNHICFAESRDGKNFTKIVRKDGKTGAFGEGIGANTRDAMVLKIGRKWHCYYTAMPNDQGVVYCRTSTNLIDWSSPSTVSYGGEAGTNQWSSECPHVIRHDGAYYLLRTQAYGTGAVTRVYRSSNPLMFGINQDPQYLVGRLPVAAPEFISHQGKEYLAYLRPDLKGIQITPLSWVKAD